MNPERQVLWDAWIEANRAYRAHQGRCAECARSLDVVGCWVAFELYQVREAVRIARDDAR